MNLTGRSQSRPFVSSKKNGPLRTTHLCRTSISSDQLQLKETLKSLQNTLQDAIKREDYSAAASLKKEIDALKQSDPVLVLKSALSQAVAEERYSDAAVIKEKLLEAEKEQAASTSDSDDSNTKSDMTTHGIRVQVESVYLPFQSRPTLDEYMFGYHISISNEGSHVVQLRHRHWKISDANGRLEEVRGPGVVGQQPILLPGQSFEYTSHCPLATPTGSMEGQYTFVVLDETDGTFKESLQVTIGKFALKSTAYHKSA